MRPIKTNVNWRRHMPGRPQRVTYTPGRPPKSLSKKIVTRVIIVILFLLIIQSVFQIPYLRIEKFELLNNKDLSADEVNTIVENELNKSKWMIFRHSNYFFANETRVEEALLSSFNLDSVSVSKKFPDRLYISVSEKISHFIWLREGSYYLLDAEGVKNRQISGPDNKYIVLDDQRSQISEGETVFDQSDIEIINQIFIKWNQHIQTRAKLLSAVITDDPASWVLHTDVGYTVKINADESIDTQIANLEQILTAGNIAGGDIDYIDVRFGDRVYFK